MNRSQLVASSVIVTASAAVLSAGARTRRRRRYLTETSMQHRRSRPAPPGLHRLTVVVPAFREPRIGASVHELKRALAEIDQHGGLEIIVVDDGSGDGTAERALEAGADVVLRLPRNLGKGAAVREGMLAAAGRVVAFTDADLSYSPDQILGLLEQIEDGWDVVVGNRGHDETMTVVETSRLRSLGHRGVNLLTRPVLRARHADTQCGLKAFRSDVARAIFAKARVERFAFDIEVLHLVERHGYSLMAVPVRLTNSEHSSVRLGRDTARLVRDLARIAWWDRSGAYGSSVDPLLGATVLQSVAAGVEPATARSDLERTLARGLPDPGVDDGGSRLAPAS